MCKWYLYRNIENKLFGSLIIFEIKNELYWEYVGMSTVIYLSYVQFELFFEE